MFKNIIFDWSGTLVDDLALTLDASNYVFSQYGKPCMNRDEFRAEFQLPYPDYYARVLPHADLDELEDHFRYAFRVSNAPVKCCRMPGNSWSSAARAACAALFLPAWTPRSLIPNAGSWA